MINLVLDAVLKELCGDFRNRCTRPAGKSPHADIIPKDPAFYILAAIGFQSL